MEASTSTPGNESTEKVKKEYTESDIEIRQLFEAMRGLSPERKKCPMGDIEITPQTIKTGSWTTNGDETGKRIPERVQRSILATVERPVQKCQQAHNESVIRLKRRLPAFKSWNTSLLKKREIAELQNDYMGIGEIQDDVGEGEEPNQKDETKTSKKDEANNNKEEGMAYTKAKNQKIIGEIQKDGRNENQNIVECGEKNDEQETGTSKNDEADNNKEEGMANKKATNQKINEEINPFDDPKFGEYYIQNEHLFVPTQTSAEKKKDQTDDVNWDSFLENEEEIIRKGREFSAEIRKKAQQQEREQKKKRQKEKDQ
ncbi:hypothetical protein Tco_0959259 [Tanacetum coccineum]